MMLRLFWELITKVWNWSVMWTGFCFPSFLSLFRWPLELWVTDSVTALQHQSCTFFALSFSTLQTCRRQWKEVKSSSGIPDSSNQCFLVILFSSFPGCYSAKYGWKIGFGFHSSSVTQLPSGHHLLAGRIEDEFLQEVWGTKEIISWF